MVGSGQASMIGRAEWKARSAWPLSVLCAAQQAIGVAALVRLISLILLIAGPLALPVRAGDASALAVLESTIADAYPDLRHLAPEALVRMMSDAPDKLVILDVREEAEWRVSRLAGARRVQPSVWTYRFLADHKASVAGKTVVLYCSVGVRSSKLAGRVQKALAEAGATAVYNLSGGIFRWHNESRPLVADRGASPFVHPYDGYWGRYVARQPLIRTAPPVVTDVDARGAPG